MGYTVRIKLAANGLQDQSAKYYTKKRCPMLICSFLNLITRFISNSKREREFTLKILLEFIAAFRVKKISNQIKVHKVYLCYEYI